MAENGENSKTRDFDDPYLAIGCSDQRSPTSDGDGESRTHWDDKWQAGMVPRKTQKDPERGVQHEDFPSGHPS